MRKTKKTIIGGAFITGFGLALYVYAAHFIPSYAGYSGGGMSGLPAALMVMGGLTLIGLGILIVLITLIIFLFKYYFKK